MQQLITKFNGDKEKINGALNDCLIIVPAMIANLQKQANAEKNSVVANIACSLHKYFSSIDATTISDIALKIQDASKANETDNIKSLSKDLKDEFMALTCEIESWLKNNKTTELEANTQAQSSNRDSANPAPEVKTGLKQPEISDLPVFDAENMLKRLMGNKDICKTVIEHFLSDAPNLLREILTETVNNNAIAAGNVGHSLKGAAASVGGNRLAHIGFLIQNAGEENQIDTIKLYTKDIETNFQELKYELESWISN